MQTFESIRNRLQSQAASRFNCPPEKLKQEHRLFIDWMASELSALHRDLHRSDDAILKRIINRLTPDIHTRPTPAHLLAYAQPRAQTGYQLRPEEDVLTIPRLGQEAPHTLFFAPLLPSLLVKARVKYLAAGQSLRELAEYNNAHTRLSAKPGAGFHPGVLWVGVQMDAPLPVGAQLCFYIDWKQENPSRKTELYKLLPLVKWLHNGRELQVSPGFWCDSTAAERHHSRYVDEEFMYLAALEKQIFQQYDHCFVSLPPFELQAGTLPEEIKNQFEEGVLNETLGENLVWFRLQFPAGFFPEEIRQTLLQLNCFPVVNRRLDRTRDFMPSGGRGLEVVALSNADKGRAALQEMGAFFLGIQRIFTRNADYKPVAFDHFRNAPPGYYALQRGRVEAGDFRDLYGRIAELTEVIQQHASTLTLLDQYQVTQAMNAIGNGAEALETALREAPPKDLDLGYYLHLKVADPQEMIYVRFWLTQGEYARGVCRPGDMLASEKTQVLEGDLGWVV